MRYAYHWNDEASGLLEMEERWFRVALGLTSPLRNLVIRTGNISIGSFPEPGASRLDALAEAVGEPLGLWSSFTADGYQELLVRYSTLAIVASGLTREEGVGIHRSIRRDVPAYVGAVEVDNRIAQQWALFDRLPLRYRVVGRELRLLWSEILSDDPPPGSLDDWRSRKMFAKVALEDVAVRQSVFDGFDDFETASRVAIPRRGQRNAFSASVTRSLTGRSTSIHNSSTPYTQR